MAELNLQMLQLWEEGLPTDERQVLELYPQSAVLSAPPDTPDNAAVAFVSGLRNLEAEHGPNANAAAAMFRRSLELSVRVLDPDAGRISLLARIERLPGNVITPSMKEWAHQIRLGGNDAVHEPDEVSLEEAELLRRFTELFLTYAFTLPAMLLRARVEAE